MKVTKRQLRRIIREAFDYNDAEYANEMAAEDYKKGYAAGHGGMALSPYANDDYAAGYEDGVADAGRTHPLRELGKGWQLSRGECDTHNISPAAAAEAMAVLGEFGYSLFIPPAVDDNQAAINDALAAYPGEYSYEDFLCAIRVTQGRGG